ncbi:DUF362 domain-containing protein [Sunxiuqinia sp. A32]|uniref:DUF362 domain-containing protein n=1 Tax=Sunxiuqinia sp. A32 TaxID=3461496 RepID=UPI004045F21C
MKRRNFIKNTALATASLISVPAFAKTQTYKLVSIRGGSSIGMLELGLDALGGIEKFVSKGQKVLIKPTLRWEKTPEQAANTNPKLLAKLVELCYEAGSRGVYLFDQTIDPWTKAYKASGIERAVKDAHAKILPGNRESLYQQVNISDGKTMQTAKFHELVDEVDVIINMPVLKIDGENSISGALKNMKQLVWEPEKYSDECVMDILRYKKPALNIIDANRVITRNASVDDVSTFRTLIFSIDIVAADSYAAKRVGIDPNQISLIKSAHAQGFGQIELPSQSVKSIILKQQKTRPS